MRPILPALLALIVASAMLGCGQTPSLDPDSQVYGVTINASGEPTTHYRSQKHDVDRHTPGIFCPHCLRHVPLLQDDPTRASWLETPPAAPPEPSTRMRLRFVPGDECDCECCPAGPC